MTNKWSGPDEKILRDLYPTYPKSAIQERLPDRTWCSIQHRAERLGIIRDPTFQYEGMIRNTLTNNPMNNPESRKKSSQKQMRYGAMITQGENRVRFIMSKEVKCSMCGKSVGFRQFCIHHQDRNRHNQTENNLVLLCRTCHNKEHKVSKNLGVWCSKTAKVKSIQEIGEIDTWDLHTPIYHNFVLSNGIISHNSMKSGINIELGTFMDKHFTADKIGFTDQEFLDKFKVYTRKAFIMRDEVTTAGEYGIGSGRMQSFITIQTETLRQNQVSIGTISPTEKELGTAHYILHSIGSNKFRLDDQGMALEPVYVLVGIMNPATHNYLGSVIFEIDWMSKVWKDYQVKKKEFLRKVQDMNFAKQDMEALAKKSLKDPLAKFAKTKHDWLIIIQRTHPSLTTEEMAMLYSMIKMSYRVKNGITNGQEIDEERE